MRPGGVLSWLRRAGLALGILGGVWIVQSAAVSTTAGPEEIRALWVTRASLTSPASVAALVSTAHAQGFNTLLVQVRGRGDAYYTSDVEPRAADLARQPASFDPLAAVLSAARAEGIRVHAW